MGALNISQSITVQPGILILYLLNIMMKTDQESIS